MTIEQLKEALVNKKPVIVNSPGLENMEYLFVSAIIYRHSDGKYIVTAEVQDRSSRSVSIVNPRHIKYKEESEVAGQSEDK